MTTVQMEKTRTEHDFLGDRAVLQSCYYGIHTLRAIENFQISAQSVGQLKFYTCDCASQKSIGTNQSGLW